MNQLEITPPNLKATPTKKPRSKNKMIKASPVKEENMIDDLPPNEEDYKFFHGNPNLIKRDKN
jgi:hypothetical protein